MESVISWLNQYWWACLLGLTIAMKILRKITKHFSEHKGLVKWCLFLVDVLDILKASPAQCEECKKVAKTKKMSLLLMLFLPLLIGCAPTFSGKLADAHTAIDAVTGVTLKIMHGECLARAKACAKQGIKKPVDCAPWRACDNAWAGLLEAVQGVEDGLLAVDQAHKVAKGAGVLR